MTNYLYMFYIYFAQEYTNDNTLCCVSDGTITLPLSSHKQS